MTISEFTQTFLFHWIPRLLAGLSVFLLFYLLGHFSKHLIFKLAKTRNVNTAYALSWIGRLAKILLIVIGLISAAAAMGVDVSALVASLGLTGVALGLAMKESVSNFFAGTMVLIHPPCHLGDFIKVASFEGEVITINLRYTVLLHEGETILIPNITLLTSPIVICKSKDTI